MFRSTLQALVHLFRCVIFVSFFQGITLIRLRARDQDIGINAPVTYTFTAGKLAYSDR